MSDKKLIAVVGATGSQGGSVLQYLLTTGRYRVRALTRNTSSPKALALKKWGNDLELFQCDMNDADQVIKAFTGCYGAFCMTDFWQDPKRMIDQEFNLGRILIDAAVEAKVKHCIWSSLHNVNSISEGKLTVPHFTNKALVEEYARTEFKGVTIDTSFSFVYPGFYLQNLLYFSEMRLKLNEEGLLVNVPLPIDPNTKLPVINITEFGGFVLGMFDNFNQFKNFGRLFAFNGFATFPQILDLIAQNLGTKSKFIRCSYDDYYKNVGDLELVHMLRFFNDYGYYGREDLGESRKWFKDLRTVEQTIPTLDWKSTLTPSLPQKLSSMVTETIGAVKQTVLGTGETSKQAE